MEPSDSQEKSNSTTSAIGSKLLAKYADTDSLFVRNNSIPTAASKPAAIPLQRFQELEQAIRHAPANPAPYVELGRTYIEQERWQDAKRVLEAGVKYCSEHEPILILHEDLLVHLSAGALEEARKRQAQRPSEENRYAVEQAETDLANRRVSVCADRFARHPDQKDLLVPWAVALRQLNRQEEAVAMLQEAAEEPELRARASLQLGMCLQSLERPLEALAAFRKAALYRSPPPDSMIKTRALELAISIAEENQLIDSARFYTQQLLANFDTAERSTTERDTTARNTAERDASQRELLAANLKRLQETEL